VDDFRVAFGARVRELRRRLGVSQEELAHRAGMHFTYLGGIERGERNPALVNIARLSIALDVSLAEFFSVFADRLRARALPAKRKTRRPRR